jgi:hypothetical protein
MSLDNERISLEKEKEILLSHDNLKRIGERLGLRPAEKNQIVVLK